MEVNPVIKLIIFGFFILFAIFFVGFLLQRVLGFHKKFIFFLPSIGILILAIYFFGRLLIYYLSGDASACHTDPMCMDEFSGPIFFYGFSSLGVAFILGVIARVLNVILDRKVKK